jgi:5-methylcytosine-specific restriction enzyme A
MPRAPKTCSFVNYDGTCCYETVPAGQRYCGEHRRSQSWAGAPTASTDATRSNAWRKLRLEVLVRDGWTCRIRGPKCIVQATDVDHIVEVSDGGADLDPQNCQAACRPCHDSKTGRHARARQLGRPPDYAADGPKLPGDGYR